MRVLPLLPVLLLAACSGEVPPAAAPVPPPASAPVPAAGDPAVIAAARRAAAGGPLPPVAGLFEVESRADGESVGWELRVWRSASRFETRESRHDTGEAWLRGPGGGIAELQRLFHGPRKAIDYGEGDLRVLGSRRSWDSVAKVMDPAHFPGTLRRTGDGAPSLGLPSEWWEGEVEGFRMRVRWIPSLDLPAEAHRSRGGEALLLRLREVHPLDGAPWSPPSATGYDRVEFADLGDRHGDPFFRQFQHGGGGELRGDGYEGHGHR